MNNPIKSFNENVPFLLYGSDDQKTQVKVVIKDDTIWLTQKSIGELFETSTDNISLQIKNIYAEQELIAPATTEEFSVVQNESGRDVRRKLKFYNLDAIIAVGYRVNSRKIKRVHHVMV